MKLHLVTYGCGTTRRGRSFFETACILRDAAIEAGFDYATAYNADLYAGTDFARRNADLLTEWRGAGYWVWKPLVIRTALETIGDDDVLIYSDAGKLPAGPITRPDRIAQLAKLAPEGFLSGVQLTGLRHDRWTKRDCFVLMDADLDAYRMADQLMVGWSAWTKSPQCFDLLEKWQHFNEDRRIVTDDPNVMGLPNSPTFKEHRHDQSIYTNLVFALNMPFLRLSQRPARRFVRQLKASKTTTLRKFWGGEWVLAQMDTHFTAKGSNAPVQDIYKRCVRRFSDDQIGVAAKTA